MKKLKKLLFIGFCLVFYNGFAQSHYVVSEFFPGLSTGGDVTLIIKNTAGTTVYSKVYDSVSDNELIPFSSAIAGTYSVTITNNANEVLNLGLCQPMTCASVKEQVCGQDSPPNASVNYTIAVGAAKTFDVILSNVSGLGQLCNSDLGSDFNYNKGFVYLKGTFRTQVTCEFAPDAAVSVANGVFVNDSTFNVSEDSIYKLGVSCPDILYPFSETINGSALDFVSGVMTANIVYTVGCSGPDDCVSTRKIYLNKVASCVIPTRNSTITGIVMNANYEGSFLFHVVAPRKSTNQIDGSCGVYIGNSLIETIPLSGAEFDFGGYFVKSNGVIHVGGNLTNPEIKDGVIRCKINGEDEYKVNFHYESHGAWITPPPPYAGNTVKPQGLSVSYSSCVNGKTRVWGNSEDNLTYNGFGDSAKIMSIQMISPTLINYGNPTFVHKFSFPEPTDQNIGDGGAVWDLGDLTAGIPYTFRVLGIGGIAANNYADISITPSCPNPSISGTVSICKGSSTTLTAKGCVSNICWSTGATTSTITVKPEISTVYEVSCLTVDGDVNRGQTTVNVINNAVVLTLSSSKATYLPNEIVSLTASGCASGTVVWSNGQTGRTVTFRAASDVVYSAHCSVNGCKSAYSNISVNVDLSPPIVTGDVSGICENGGNILLTASGCNTPATYVWSNTAVTPTISVASIISTYWVACFYSGNFSEKTYIVLKR